MEEGAWLVLPYAEELAFPGEDETLWERGLARLGIDRGTCPLRPLRRQLMCSGGARTGFPRAPSASRGTDPGTPPAPPPRPGAPTQRPGPGSYAPPTSRPVQAAEAARVRRGGRRARAGTRPGRRGAVADQALALSEPEGRVRERPATASTGPLTGGSRAGTPRRTLAALASHARRRQPQSPTSAFSASGWKPTRSRAPTRTIGALKLPVGPRKASSAVSEARDSTTFFPLATRTVSTSFRSARTSPSENGSFLERRVGPDRDLALLEHLTGAPAAHSTGAVVIEVDLSHGALLPPFSAPQGLVANSRTIRFVRSTPSRKAGMRILSFGPCARAASKMLTANGETP